MSNNKSFFQKLSDSITSIFPFNSTAKELPNISQASFEKHLSPIRYHLNRRVASEAFGKEDYEIKNKRAKLHHDPLCLPSSRIIKQPVNQNSDKIMTCGNNFNDAASDFSDTSNISVSTSGVSSLHPRSSKRMNFGHMVDTVMQSSIKTPNNINLSQRLFSPVLQKSFKDNDGFMSSPARKILEKLDRLTTPITAADRLSSIAQKERYLSKTRSSANDTSYSPYSRPTPPVVGKRPLPTKAVTVSASSDQLVKSSCGPIRRKQTQRTKKLGFTDDIDLDSELLPNELPKLISANKLDFSNRLPPLKKSQSTNTDESLLFASPLRQRESSPPLEFTFRSPTTINDDDYSSGIAKSPPTYQFKSKIPEEEIAQYIKQRTALTAKCQSPRGGLWRCNTCFMENDNHTNECSNCGNLLLRDKKHHEDDKPEKSSPEPEESKPVDEVKPVVEEVKKVAAVSAAVPSPVKLSPLPTVTNPPIDVSVPPPSMMFRFGNPVAPPTNPPVESTKPELFDAAVPPPAAPIIAPSPFLFGTAASNIDFNKAGLVNTAVPPPFEQLPPAAAPFLFGQSTTTAPVLLPQLPISSSALAPTTSSLPAPPTTAASSLFTFGNSTVDNHKPKSFSFGDVFKAPPSTETSSLFSGGLSVPNGGGLFGASKPQPPAVVSSVAALPDIPKPSSTGFSFLNSNITQPSLFGFTANSNNSGSNNNPVPPAPVMSFGSAPISSSAPPMTFGAATGGFNASTASLGGAIDFNFGSNNNPNTAVGGGGASNPFEFKSGNGPSVGNAVNQRRMLKVRKKK